MGIRKWLLNWLAEPPDVRVYTGDPHRLSGLMGGYLVEVAKIENGFLLIRQKGNGFLPDIKFIASEAEIGEALTTMLVAEKLIAQQQVAEMIGAAAKVYASGGITNYHAGGVLK